MSKADQLPWDVLLIAGASGTGKTSVSYSLAQHFGVGICEVDDLFIVLETLTTPEQQPKVHYWRTKPDDVDITPDLIIDLHLSVARVLQPAIKAVIANHIETKTPIILEGDYLLPELLTLEKDNTAWNTERVHAVFLYEESQQQLIQNFLSREPEEGEQVGRANVSVYLGELFKKECARHNITALPARPWGTLQARIIEAIS